MRSLPSGIMGRGGASPQRGRTGRGAKGGRGRYCQGMTDEDLLDLAATLAERAAHAINAIRAAGFAVERKSDASPVTEADRVAEALIVEGLRAATPDIPVVAEEEVSAGILTALAPRTWLVDPLDGTREFAAGHDTFAVNVGLVVEGFFPDAGASLTQRLRQDDPNTCLMVRTPPTWTCNGTECMCTLPEHRLLGVARMYASGGLVHPLFHSNGFVNGLTVNLRKAYLEWHDIQHLGQVSKPCVIM